VDIDAARKGGGHPGSRQQIAMGQKRARSRHPKPLQNFSPRRSGAGPATHFALPLKSFHFVFFTRGRNSHRRALCTLTILILFPPERQSTPRRSPKQCESKSRQAPVSEPTEGPRGSAQFICGAGVPPAFLQRLQRGTTSAPQPESSPLKPRPRIGIAYQWKRSCGTMAPKGS
jgi:hypothetical protein